MSYKKLLAAIFLTCSPLAAQVTNTCTAPTCTAKLSWTQPAQEVGETVASVRVTRNSTLLASLPVTTLTYSDLGLPPGTYTYVVTNVDPAGNLGAAPPVIVVVTPVTPPPGGFQLNPIAPLLLTTSVGVNPPAQSINFSDNSPIWPIYALATDQPWLTATISMTHTATGYVIPIKVTSATMLAGSYTGNITISIPNQSGYTWISPVVVPVILTVKSVVPPPPPPATGFACVRTSNPSTTETWSCTATNPPLGTSTITYTPNGGAPITVNVTH